MPGNTNNDILQLTIQFYGISRKLNETEIIGIDIN